jgi:hypothetical protein
MKSFALFVCLISISSTFANEVATKETLQLSCLVNDFGIKELSIQQDETGITGLLQMDLLLVDGSEETKNISYNEFKKLQLGLDDLYITNDGDLYITLKKINNDTYSISERGDGHSQTKLISCK